MNEVLTEEQSTTVLLETMSGKGSEIGRNFDELRQIIDRVERKIRWVSVLTPVMSGMADMIL